ncbi:E3 ubiquitin-protein ligase RNF123-like [Elysia marginata]|uniref:E3 ubiquitin-protein ligase RNF123-like n=1 Tax=Elysia marginata TaxID=1093978 RepID=A0AAV4GZR3_9GAST|nr:E3 ubiquitin-protein ligase RNF123-like [Elysia marginata]
MHIKAPDDPNLARLIPNVWWDKTLKKEEDDSEDEDLEELEETPAERINRKKFELCCERLGERIEELESIQVELLKCLLINNDYIEGKTSRDLFLVRLKTFLRDHSTFNRPQVAQCSLPVILCFFHRLIQALRFYWDQTSVPSTEAFMPIQCFWNESRDYFELLRCGGLMSHLNRQLSTELNRAQGIEVQEDGKVVKKTKDSASSKSEDDYPKLDALLGNSLEEILDCVVLLYHIAAHRQLGKMCALRESMLDFVVNLRDTEKKIRKCPDELSEVKEYLEGAKMVFVEKIVEQARQMVWVEKVIYSPFFYVSGLPNLLNWYARFLVNHFFDSRLVSNDLKDTLVQALACFTCYPDTLKILEEMPMENRILMIQSLISPYENRSWAHTNWILVRIWKGCGFGYRYRYLPNLIPHKAQPTEFSYVSLQRLDTVTFYPILTVTVGIMAQLIVRCGGSSQEKATRSLLLDSSFSLDSLKFVLGENMAIRGKPDKAFSFRKFDEISVEEMEDVEKLMSYLSQQQVSLTASEEVVKEDELCTICYANRQQAVFVPCGHKSCRVPIGFVKANGQQA